MRAIRNVVRNTIALLCGIIGLILALSVEFAFQEILGLQLSSMMLWGIIPLGALILGAISASGYYAGALKMQLKPTRNVVIGMTLLTAIFQLLLYYAYYATARTADDQQVNDIIGFVDYTAWSLTNAKQSVVIRGYSPGEFKAGLFGYVVAFLQFLALISTGIGAHAVLSSKPYCDSCGKYLKTVRKAKLAFSGGESTIAELQNIKDVSALYFDRLSLLSPGSEALLELDLYVCPACGKEAITEKPMLIDGRKFAYKGELFRTIWNSSDESIASKFETLAQ